MVTTSPTTEAECGACRRLFPTLAEVFSHPCDVVPQWMADRTGGARIIATNRGDSIDAPERHERTSDSPPAAKPVRSNRYPGPCLRCGGHVEAGEGLLTKNHAGGRGESWAVEHKVSECPAIGTPAQGTPVVDDNPVNDDMPAARPATAPVRPNRYGGNCADCSHWVDEQAGTITKNDADKWEVRHLADECVVALQDLPDVPAGRYAIPSGGDNDLVFLKVDRPTKGEYAGRLFLRMVVGGHADTNVPRAQVLGYLEAIMAAGPDEAMRRYGQELGACGRCGRHLTDEVSRADGLGPTCRARG